jgi:hypothetical protein
MLRDTRLAQLQPLDELVHGPLALAQELENLAPRRLGEGGEGGSGSRAHGEYITRRLYIARTTAVKEPVFRGCGSAQSNQTITASPKTIKRTDTQTVRGRGWSVIEFCSRTVRVFVRSAQNSAPIAQRHIRDTGRFTFARMRCESGKDGSRFFVRASTRITIN